jgi:16S rRNA processing protein RimM
MPRSADDVILGVVTGAHGLEGEVKVKTFTGAPESLGAYGPVTTGDGRQLAVAGLRAVKGGEALVRFKGITNRNAAESLKGQKLLVPRAALPDPEEGEFYLADLVGCAVEDRSGKSLGQVLAVHNFGAGDMIEIGATGGETRFIPFTDDAVPAVDIAGRRIVVEIPSEVEGEKR